VAFIRQGTREVGVRMAHGAPPAQFFASCSKAFAVTSNRHRSGTEGTATPNFPKLDAVIRRAWSDPTEKRDGSAIGLPIAGRRRLLDLPARSQIMQCGPGVVHRAVQDALDCPDALGM